MLIHEVADHVHQVFQERGFLNHPIDTALGHPLFFSELSSPAGQENENRLPMASRATPHPGLERYNLDLISSKIDIISLTSRLKVS